MVADHLNEEDTLVMLKRRQTFALSAVITARNELKRLMENDENLVEVNSKFN